MAAEPLEEQTFLPTEGGQHLAPVLSFLTAHEDRGGGQAQPSYALVGVDEHDRIELPENVHQALKGVVTALLAGKAVTVAPHSMTLTSQQAADLLGVSRPTVKRLIDKGELPAERVGTRHRLRLDEVLAYRDSRRSRQYAFLAETATNIDAEAHPDEVREQLREVRRLVAQRRKTKG